MHVHSNRLTLIKLRNVESREFMILIVITSLFFFEHAEFFEFTNDHITRGYAWSYTGKRICDENEPCLPIVDKETGERLTYFMLAK